MFSVVLVPWGDLFHMNRRMLTRRLLPALGVSAALAGSGVGVAAIVAGPATPAFAGSGTALGVNVKDAKVSLQDTANNKCTYDVTSDLTLINLENTSQSITDVSQYVVWHGANGSSGVQDAVTVTDNAGLTTSVTLPANGRQTFTGYAVQVTIPCEASSGDLSISVTTPMGKGSGDAPFLLGGTPLPVGEVGGIGMAALLGAGLVVLQVRTRRRTRARISA